MSKESAFKPGSPIRGGIPIAFPQFANGPLPLHGFARTSEWTVSAELSQEGDETACSAVFKLQNSAATAAIWPYNFELTYSVSLSSDGESLSTELAVRNVDASGSAPVPCQALLHTYFQADAEQVSVQFVARRQFV